MKVNICWFRRDLRIEDNTALHEALKSGFPVIPLFIFDKEILDKLSEKDARVQFIHECITEINEKLAHHNSSFLVKHGNPHVVWLDLISAYEVNEVFINKDYEPYALQRDTQIQNLLEQHNITWRPCKDQVIFEENEITKDDGNPYTVYTPYKRKWLAAFKKENHLPLKNTSYKNLFQKTFSLMTLEEIGFKSSHVKVKPYTLEDVKVYESERNFPAKDSTSYLSPHLRFGTVSVRQIIDLIQKEDEVFLSELIWREFFMQILFHFPHVVSKSFKPKYDAIPWRNNETEFKAWCNGKTGYPMVDAGMRQLNQTGYMHNRVRMVVASFLCKHLLIDWRWGEAYFASKLLDYDLSANNGNWQWAAGTGCDSAPYFRIFNPIEQLKKFDQHLAYTRKWVKDFDELTYPQPIVDHKMARERALKTYKEGMASYTE